MNDPAKAGCMDIVIWVLIGLLVALELSRLAAALIAPAQPYRVAGAARPTASIIG